MDSTTGQLYGAITIGDVWRFAVLERSAKKLTQDINLYTVPADIEVLARALIGILDGAARVESAL